MFLCGHAPSCIILWSRLLNDACYIQNVNLWRVINFQAYKYDCGQPSLILQCPCPLKTQNSTSKGKHSAKMLIKCHRNCLYGMMKSPRGTSGCVREHIQKGAWGGFPKTESWRKITWPFSHYLPDKFTSFYKPLCRTLMAVKLIFWIKLAETHCRITQILHVHHYKGTKTATETCHTYVFP